MADASLEAPAEGGSAPQAGGSSSSQDNPANAVRPEDYVEVKVEKDKATLMVKGSAARDHAGITRDTVAVKLTGLKVTACVDWKAVDDILAAKAYDKVHVIAAPVPPGQTKDAWIQEKIKIDPDVKPVVAQDGHADYKNVDNIHQVKKGDVLAVKHPAVQGEPGTDIYGKALPAPPAKDVPFKMGSNTELSADGLQLLAATGGFVYHNAGAICVGVTYTVKGDVDFRTGNLHYQGDIVVMGNVTDGFLVEAEGDVTVEGNVDAAEIVSKNGTVTVKSAVFGHGKGRIRAKKAIRLQSVQDIELLCEGEVVIETSVRNCKVTADAIKADQAGCAAVGGTLKAYREISVASLGGEGCRTELIIVDKEAEAAREKLKEIEKARAALLPRLEAQEKKLKGMKALAERFGGELSARSRGELKSSLELYAALKKDTDGLEQAKGVLGKALNSAARHTGRCVITETVVWGGYLELYGHPRDLAAEDAAKEWVWTHEGLAGRTILPDPKASPPDPDQPAPSAAPPA